MRRSQQKAYGFLALALIIGGVTGAAGNAWFAEYRRSHTAFRGAGERLFDDLGLSCDQRIRMDSVIKATEEKIRAVNAPLRARADSILTPARAQANAIMAQVQPVVDSIRQEGRDAFFGVLTQRQRERYETQMAEAVRQRREWEQPAGRSDLDNKCGGDLSRAGRGVFRKGSGPPPGQGGRAGNGSGPAEGRSGGGAASPSGDASRGGRHQ